MDAEERAAIAELQLIIDPLKRYRVKKVLGAGGAGFVVLVQHTGLKTLRAMKLVHGPYLRSQVMRDRFTREARIMAMLSSPHVLTVHDVDQVGTTPYIMMEYCPGGTLKDHMEVFGPLSPRQTARVIIDVLSALHYGHSFVDPETGEPSPVYHRDIKPENVLIDVHGVVKVADYGIAKLEQGTVNLTRAGTAMGTLAFMSPEQKTDASSADHRADLHAVGVMLWCLLKGEYPRSGNDFYFQHAEDGAILEGIDDLLQCVLLLATAKDPESRYQSAMEMMEELRQQMDGLPEDPEGLPVLGSAPKELRRRSFQDTSSIEVLPGAMVGSGVGEMQVRGTIAPLVEDGPGPTRAMPGALPAHGGLMSHVSSVPGFTQPPPVQPAGETNLPWDTDGGVGHTRAEGGFPMGTLHEGVFESDEQHAARVASIQAEKKKALMGFGALVIVLASVGLFFMWVIISAEPVSVGEEEFPTSEVAVEPSIVEPVVEATSEPVESTPEPVTTPLPVVVKEPTRVPEPTGVMEHPTPAVVQVEPEVLVAEVVSAKVNVTLGLPGGTIATVRLTGPGGTYTLSRPGQSVAVPPGTYSALATMEGRDTPQEGTVTVTEGGSVKINCNVRFKQCSGIK
ncbi:MAG: protein kinase [Parcubacteria group bacterium]|nr:protein kinase [Parcubacteria group bacterium]